MKRWVVNEEHLEELLVQEWQTGERLFLFSETADVTIKEDYSESNNYNLLSISLSKTIYVLLSKLHSR